MISFFKSKSEETKRNELNKEIEILQKYVRQLHSTLSDKEYEAQNNLGIISEKYKIPLSKAATHPELQHLLSELVLIRQYAHYNTELLIQKKHELYLLINGGVESAPSLNAHSWLTEIVLPVAGEQVKTEIAEYAEKLVNNTITC
ncbi:hypothetical protein LU604_07200 [Erwinia tracheiphila]|uniref:Uncharacterized protein n=1 Tax=Erwinia tracheiphila TaxID=65700 RepID=A0A345CT43_9GAMM|nr:hypothetical protein [Erwinia tracheiphila]AXF76610.1 hypothetical protein AV903_12105 [Erwinia tracheiphila]UIA84719.1 hypothetical protein LU604_07200 [Erwinia tracheiphila]UIA93311.1 hypothetical protein LU632_07175 [Erwinia tracheiphila]